MIESALGVLALLLPTAGLMVTFILPLICHPVKSDYKIPLFMCYASLACSCLKTVLVLSTSQFVLLPIAVLLLIIAIATRDIWN